MTNTAARRRRTRAPAPTRPFGGTVGSMGSTARASLGVALAAAHGLASCASSIEGDWDFGGAIAALLVQTREGGTVHRVRAIDLSDQGPGRLVVATSPAIRTAILSYPQPLDAYGLEFDQNGDLVLAASGGVPLPPPRGWRELPHDEAMRQVDVAATSVADAFPQIRVARAPCSAVLTEVRASRIAAPPNVDSLSLVVPLDDDRILVGLVDRQTGNPLRLAVLTSTSSTILRTNLFRQEPLAVTDPTDGSAWVFLQLGSSANPRPQLCRVRAVPGGVSHRCEDTEGSEPDFPHRTFVNLVGARRPDGRMELVAASDDIGLYHWLGDEQDQGRWRRLYQGGTPEQPNCTVGIPTASLVLTGPGTGSASLESGRLERFTIPDGGGPVVREVLFDVPGASQTSCRSVHAHHPRGGLLFIREATVEFAVPPPPEVLWRSPIDGRWTPLDTGGISLTGASITALEDPSFDDVILVSAVGHAMSLFHLDRRRPDLPPQSCPLVGVYNEAQRVTRDGSGRVVIGGGFNPFFVPHFVSRWSAERLQ